MAEGLQLESFNSKYFCHHCTREVGPFHTAELICPDCSSGFLEEVSKDLYEADALPALSDEYEYSSENDAESDDLSFIPELSMDRLISQMLLNVAESLPHEAPDAPETEEPEEPEAPSEDMFRSDSFMDAMEVNGLRNLINSSDFMDAARLREFDEYNIDEEVDALASQLLDEIEVSGPPPLSKDQIKSLPTVSMKEEHIEKGLQCTVCMDDLNLREKAKELPCNHYYHEKCITPWLERQATCPNCRDVIQVKSKSKRSKSCPRSRMNLRNGDSRRFSEATSLGDFFTASMNPFRFLN